jgi:6-phosphofructokinase 1
MDNTKKLSKILILTSGGDSPGMNAVTRAVVRTMNYYNVETYACHNGFQGLVDRDIFLLSPGSVAGTIQHGGTILKSSRCKAFLDKEVRKKVIEFLNSEGIEGIVIIGGDGSFRGAALLNTEGDIKVIGIPGTIDNDIIGTEYTIGFDTARNTALRAIDNIRDTAYSNNMYFIVEVMGQRSGFLAVDVGIAGGADHILTPEFPITAEELAQKILAPRRPKRSLIVVVAEAGKPGRSMDIVAKLRQLTPFDYRVCVLGHIQRGGSPSVMDREIGSRMGYLACESLLQGQSNKMTAIQNGQLVLVDFPGPDAGFRKLEDKALLDLGAVLNF